MSSVIHPSTVVRLAAVAVLGLAATGTTAAAQHPTSTAPWRAWLGCWSAGTVSPLAAEASLPLVCVTPTADAAVARVATVVDGTVQSSQMVDASGREVPLRAAGCSGSQTGRWSADGRRVYLRATATCDGVLRTTAAILALTPEGEWLDIRGTSVGPDESVRIVRYRDVGASGRVPAEIAAALRDTELSVHGARVATGAPVGTSAVAEAVQATTVGVAEAFVIERQQRFSLDARTLVSLADAGIPSRITDAMIAASNPGAFAVRGAQPLGRDSLDDVAGRRVYVMLDRHASPWDWGYDAYGSRYGYRYDPFNRFGYGRGYGYDYGYPGYGYGYGGGIVIVRGPGGTTASPHGRLVKGRGYERGQGASPSTSQGAVSRDRSDASSSRGASTQSTGASRGDGGSGSSGSSGSGSGGSDRTAKPRP